MKHLGNVLTIMALALLGIGAHIAAAQESVLHAFGAVPNTPTATEPPKQMAAHYASIPLSFEANQGQTDPSVRFLSRGSGYSMFLTQDEVVLNLERQQPASPLQGQTPAVVPVDTLRMKLVGASPAAAVAGTDPLPGVVSYFIGNDPQKWRAGISTYGKVSYAQVYPGVDLVFYGNQRQLEYDFVVAPGADAGRIAWQIDGARATVDAEGNLVLTAANGPASFKKPVLYQMDGDKRIAVDGSFDVATNKIGFRLGAYDHSKPLIIDPVLSYASYLGGSATDTIGSSVGGYNYTQGLALDSEGSVYVTGTTYSTNFPVENPYQSTNNVTPSNSRAPTTFVTKFSPDGSSLVYSTYLGGGGTGADYAYAIAVDANKEAYVTGQTFSNDFPITAGAYEAFCSPAPKPPNETPEVSACAGAGNNSAYVTKLNAAGTALVYSTFLGGDGVQHGVSIAVDAAGRAYVGGYSYTSCYDGTALNPAGPYPYTCFPTTSGAVIAGVPPVGTYGLASPYAFIAVFDPTGADLLYSSLFGTTINTSGGETTWTTGVNVDSSGNFYLVGYTVSPNLPTTAGVIEPTAGPAVEGQLPQDRSFIAKFNPVTATGGASLAYATYLGGQTEFRNDLANAIVVDSAGNSYVTGFTTSPDFPVTTGSYQTACGASTGACNADFVVKLNSTATAIDWSTYLGDVTGSGDSAQGAGPIALDGNGNVYITGMAGGSLFPQVNPVEPNANQTEPFVAEFDPTGKSLLFSTIIYSPNNSETAGLGVDASGDIYLAGNINGTGLIVTPGAFQQAFAGSSTLDGYGDGFVLKIAPQGTATVVLAASPSPATAGQTVTLTATVTPTGTYASVPTGTVEFQNGSTTLSTVALNSAGVATYATSTLDPGKASLTAVYSGDSTYPTVNGETTLTVNGLTATVTVTPASSSTSTSSSLSVKVTVTGSGATPTGTVTLSGGTYSSATETLSSGSYTFTIPANSFTAGPYTLSVNYSGDSNYSAATGTAPVTYTAPPPAATPVFSLHAGTYTSTQSVTITDATTGAAIYYTTDGTTPTASSTLYNGAISVSATETIEAIAVATGYSNSAVASAAYTITPPAATPVFSPIAGTYTSAQSVTITDATTGASIYYTTNGTTPTASSTLYSSAISVSTTETVEAIAVATGYTNSAVASAAYTITAATASYTLSASPSTLTIQTGSTGSTVITLTPTGGFTGTVNFSCGTLASDITCSFAPSSLTVTTAAAQTTTLTIGTTGTATASLGNGPRGTYLPEIFVAMILLPLGFTRRVLQARKSGSAWLMGLLLLAVTGLAGAGLLGMTGCGGKSSSKSTPPGTYSIAINVTSGGTSVPLNLSITVQ